MKGVVGGEDRKEQKHQITDALACYLVAEWHRLVPVEMLSCTARSGSCWR